MGSAFSFYSDSARIALQSILAHKLRAFLTLIGIIIGVASVVVVGAAISGLNTYVVEKVSKVLGTNHFMIARIASSGELSEEDLERMNRRNKQLKWTDMEWLERYCETCSAVGAEAGRGTKFEQDGKTFFGGIIFGVTANMAEIEDKTMTDGRFIQPEEVSHSKLVVVLGADIKDKFYPDVDPIGKEFKVMGLPMRVIGVEERRGPIFGDLIDKHVYIPLTTFQRIYGRNLDLQIHGKGKQRETFQLTIEDARRALRNYHELIGSEEDDFGLVNTETLGSQIDQFTGAIALVVTPITLIALVVGGIVVMNIMLVSVTERTFEIGLRKALGARRKQVLLQFLIESSMLCALGGVLGLLAAAGISWIVTVFTPITMTITVGYILLALGVSTAVGMIAGIYPAFKASRLDPIIALTKTT
jgi:putative ABC transport system permease protein